MTNPATEVIRDSDIIKKMKQYFHINDDYYALRYFQNLGLKNQRVSSEDN
ncbi:MAG TPA: hypothetical protein VH415_11905 [Nitrososphaeraceae archaeon]